MNNTTQFINELATARACILLNEEGLPFLIDKLEDLVEDCSSGYLLTNNFNNGCEYVINANALATIKATYNERTRAYEVEYIDGNEKFQLQMQLLHLK